MVKRNLEGVQYQRDHFAPYGNMCQIRVEIDLDNVARVSADVDYLMKLPRGTTITKVEMVVSNAADSGDDIDLGTEQKGTGGTWTDDVDYFLDAASIAAAIRFDSLATTRHKPLYIDEDNVYLTLTFNDAVAAGNDFAAEFYVWYETTGNR